jgi:hypothetical protein
LRAMFSSSLASPFVAFLLWSLMLRLPTPQKIDQCCLSVLILFWAVGALLLLLVVWFPHICC